jgi:hypothetical protein
MPHSPAPCAASSQRLGDCESSSITFTTLAMMKILLPLFIADRRCIVRFSGPFFLASGSNRGLLFEERSRNDSLKRSNVEAMSISVSKQK